MSFAKEPLTIVLCLDHAFGRAVGLKQPGHRPIVFAAAGPVHEARKAAGVEVVCLGQSDLLGNPSRDAAEAAGFATACHLEPVEPSQRAPIPRRMAEKVSARIEGLRSVLASISIL